MSLFSMSYIINQYWRRVFQFETKTFGKGPKPIYLKALTLGSEGVRRDSGAPGGPRPSRFGRLL
jgi:hypothetical protein